MYNNCAKFLKFSSIIMRGRNILVKFTNKNMYFPFKISKPASNVAGNFVYNHQNLCHPNTYNKYLLYTRYSMAMR